tara:strand:+ start:32 stop:1387 length:1356 start_codon:yes stop_codon:yes gene_type:complete
VENSIENILSKYTLLIPKIEYASIIIRLEQKVKNEELEEHFTFDDIEYTAREMQTETAINVETAVQYLLNFFLIKNPNRSNSYTLTQYARNFVGVISDKISSPYSNLPLKQNFEKYFNLKEEDLASVDGLNNWFNLGFDLIAKKVISDHIESLYDNLKEATSELNEILLSEGVAALQLVKQFSVIFQKFVERSREIREVINFKNSVLKQISDFENGLYSTYNSYSANERKVNKAGFEQSRKDWNTVKVIAQRVKAFFDKIDLRFENISNQIHFASKKLNELGETFEKKALLKVNLKKMLRCALEDVKHTDEGVRFHSFPLKAIPYQYIYFNAFKLYDFEIEQENPIIPLERDNAYFADQEKQFLKDVNVQERVSVWIDNLKQRLEAEKKLDISTEFQKIYTEEGNAQTPLRVSYDLINNSQSNSDDAIEIKREINSNDNKIQLWKVQLKRK